MNKVALVSLSTITLLGLGAGVYYFTSNVKASTTVHPDDQWMVDQSVNHTVYRAKASLNYPVFANGRVFPKLTWPVLKGPKNIDWNKPTLVTFGSEFASAIIRLNKTFQDTPLQFVHVIYNGDVGSIGEINKKEFQNFNDQITVMDAKTGPYDKYSKTMRQLGLFKSGYAFLLDKHRKVIFQDNTIGLGTDNLKAALEQFVAGKPITAESQVALTPNQTLPTDFLPNDIQKAVKAELSKKTTLVFFKSTDCTICTPWSESLDSYFEKWKSKGYGIVLITGNQSDYGMKTNRNIIEISDKSTSTPDRSEIFTAWNVRGFPAAYLLEKGKYRGWVSFRFIKTDNGNYFDIQMKAIDVLLQSK
ncbi:MAG: hypothetical protein U0Z75_08830 [Deinococcaceae bacterium]